MTNAPCDVEDCPDTETLPLTQNGHRPAILCGRHLIEELTHRGIDPDTPVTMSVTPYIEGT